MKNPNPTKAFQPPFETMESRLLLSQTPGLLGPVGVKYLGKTPVTASHATTTATKSKSKAKTTAKIAQDVAATAPFTPNQLRHFYGADSINFGSVVGDGSGQTIVLVDYNSQPNIVSDLATFDTTFNLPAPPSFIVESQTGSTPPTSYDSGDALEISLDVEYAHAMAPKANLVLIETSFSYSSNSNFMNQFVQDGVARADAIGNVSVVSMSYGVPEYSGETSLDSYFKTTGITYVASAGDNGSAKTVYPSISPNVVSVGGTAITTADSSGSYGSETVWNDSSGATGGNISRYESKPSYQSAVTQSSTKRTTPDVSLEASANTGVQVYDSSQSSPGFYQVGGTSLSAPSWAGLIAVADQGRELEGLSTLSGSTQTLPTLYHLPSTDFHDITTGNNNYNSTGGYSAGNGYDLATGIGTPYANTLVDDLAGVASITGKVFVDANNNGTFDSGETPLSGQTVYLDLNNTGTQTSSDPTATTDSTGTYTFPAEAAGGTVRLVTPALSGYVKVPTTTSAVVSYGATDTANFAFFPITYSTTTAATNYTLQSDSTGTVDQILVNGVVTDSVSESLLSALSFSLTGAGDTFTINAVNGNPIPTGGITFTGSTSGDVLSLIGTASGNDSFTVTSSAATFDSTPISFTRISSLLLDPGAGLDSLAVNSGSATVVARSSGSGILTRNFSSLSVASAASALFATASDHNNRMLVETSALSALGKLDLGGNDMIIHGADLTAITKLVATGYANGTWTGTGITSAAAAGDTTHLTALGVIQNTLYGGTNQPQFDGVSPVASDILIKYTYYGDSNLDGKVDGTDYSRIDNGYLTTTTGWSNGDFNFDSHIDGSDYSLIDNDFNMQGGPL